MESQFFFNGGKTRRSNKKTPIMIDGVMIRGSSLFIGKQLSLNYDCISNKSDRDLQKINKKLKIRSLFK